MSINYHILIVEDDYHFRLAISLLLEEAGFSVTHTSSARSALQIMRNTSVNGDRLDLVLTDLHLPGMSGLEMLQQAAQAKIVIPALLMTAYNPSEVEGITGKTGEELMQSLQYSGCTGVVEKPSHPEVLLSAVRKAIADSGGHRRRMQAYS